MRCIDCCYRKDGYKDLSICGICHRVTIGCNLTEESIEKIPKLKICYNCKSWIGGGDWGLSCKKDYYNTNSNGFEEGCDKFEWNN